MRGSDDVKVGLQQLNQEVFRVPSCSCSQTWFATLDNHFRPPLISHKHMLHLCREELTMYKPDLTTPTKSCLMFL